MALRRSEGAGARTPVAEEAHRRGGEPQMRVRVAAAGSGSLATSATSRRAVAEVARLPLRPIPARSFTLPDEFRHGAVIADEVLRPARKVGELRGGDIDPQALIERGEDVAEMNRPGARLLAPARRRAEHLPAAHAAARQQRAAH